MSSLVSTMTYDRINQPKIISTHYRPLWHRTCSNYLRQHRNVCKTPTATFRLTLHSLLLNAGSSPPAFFLCAHFSPSSTSHSPPPAALVRSSAPLPAP